VSGEQKIRAFLFYLSLTVFLIGLPTILSFAFGYKFNPRTIRFVKTGLITFKTQPAGASVYLDGKLFNEKTPAAINELLPGDYNIRIELEKHYPWSSQVSVEEGKVARLEKIILFPLRPHIRQLNKEKISSFWVDSDNKKVYYFNQEEKVVYRSNLDGENFEEAGNLPEDILPLKEYKISPDRDKLLCFNARQIAVIYLKSEEGRTYVESPLVLEYAGKKIEEVFWHSDSYHLILVTDRTIDVLEAKPEAVPVNLVNLEKKGGSVFYDEDRDTLYFMDAQKAADGKFYDNAYKLELGTKLYPFMDLMKQKSDE